VWDYKSCMKYQILLVVFVPCQYLHPYLQLIARMDTVDAAELATVKLSRGDIMSLLSADNKTVQGLLDVKKDVINTLSLVRFYVLL